VRAQASQTSCYPPLVMFSAFVVYAGCLVDIPLGFSSVGVYAPGLGHAAGLKSTVPARLSVSMIAQFYLYCT
jgi:hypothetical protein